MKLHVVILITVLFSGYSMATEGSNYHYLSQWGSKGPNNGQFDGPWGITADLAGYIYVTDTSGNHRVQKFTNDGEFVISWGSYGSDPNQFHSPTGIVADASGSIYVADQINNRVLKFTSNGDYITMFDAVGLYPMGIAIGDMGHVYVAVYGDDVVREFTSDGNLVREWGGRGSGDRQFRNPVGIAIDSAGNVYVADSGNYRVQKFSSDGTFVTKWGSQGSENGQFDSPYGICVDSPGNVIVTENVNRRLQKFTSNGDFLTKWGGPGTGDGQFDAPIGVVVDSFGYAYITDHMNNRVQKFGVCFRLLYPNGGENLVAGKTYPITWQRGPTVYSSDFEDPCDWLLEWSNTSWDVTPGTAQHPAESFLGQFGNETVSLVIDKLPSHTHLVISCDLYVIGTWDGTGTMGGETVSVYVEGGPTLLDKANFSNQELHGNPRQAYPSVYPGGDHPARTGAAENNTLGFFQSAYGHIMDSVYHFPNEYHDLAFAHSDPNLVLTFSGSGLQSLSDESWGLDNVTVTVIDVNDIRLEYSTDNGGNWYLIDPCTPYTPNDGKYDWLVPEVTSNQCLVRITDTTYPNITDTSDDVFAIYVCQLPPLAQDADMDDNCKVDFIDFSLWSLQWLKNGNPFDPACTECPTGMAWVSINDPGVSGHEGFNGEMSKYETTNAQYCQFLNAALASGDIYVDSNIVYGSNGSNSGADFVGDAYYDLAGSGYTYNEATNGGAARIHYSGGVFIVDSGFEDHPVTYVSWYGATAFCDYYAYRLPSEWEWRAVADYDGLYMYGCGTSIDNSIANYLDSTHPHGTTTVGNFGTYGYGMCDMAGNVWEWTSSIRNGTSYYLCGGCWGSGAVTCEVLYSVGSGEAGRTDSAFGFRVCRDVEVEPVAFHVDGISGDDGNDGLTRETAFETIQKGIDTAEDGNLVLVWPGVYVGQIYFYGKAITLKSADYPAVIEAPWQDAISFIVSEGPASVLSNFVIRDSMTAIACNNESSPTLKNLTIVDNAFGIAAYENSQPNIANCILWRNEYGDLYGCEAQYSCVETGSTGVGSISADPLFADIDGGNYHLLSENGRYVPAYGLWSFDDVTTSPCVDAGDPADDFSAERMPNGSRVNMGAYGGTPYASMGEWPKRSSATVTQEWISRMARASAMNT